MGNLFGMMKQAVHPWSRAAQGWEKIPAACGGGVRIKVRMTKAELKELMAAVDLSKGSSDLGLLIFRELSKGRYQASADLIMPEEKSVKLTSISEEKDDDDDDHDYYKLL